MFEIDDTTKLIKVTRGDIAPIEFSIEDYQFRAGDIVRIGIYKARKLNEKPVFEKSFEVDEDKEKVDMLLTSDDTQFGEMKNKPIDYWYEIELNGSQTVIGYNDSDKNNVSKNGEKIFRLLPEGYVESGVE